MPSESKGTRLKRMREARDLTQEDVAKALGVSKQTIHKYEKDIVTNIPSDKIDIMAKLYRVSPAEIMGWDVGSVRTTTTMTFDGDSPMHALTQAYLRHPKAVQDEILVRLDRLDVTFSKNVSKLLMDSGDVNGFMQKTGLDFMTVGKLMQGETVWTTPEEAERIAAYFGIDVVKMFFEDVRSTEKAQDEPKESGAEFIDRLGAHAKRVYFFYQRECNRRGRPTQEDLDRSMRIVTSSKFNKMLQRIIREAPEDADFDKAYAKLAHALYLSPDIFIRWLVQERSLHNFRKVMFGMQDDSEDA
ncbi:helix-turn-helix transcriptional regulator [uncultured Selenomonas sp.]|uniref:helix-turn-helix domain-containing protein n=1 Tax=uncultured Selenomonas sp. TaxID=159275 RepID=UPI0028E7D5E9|nr:helix-turn-helix transcriptional regulator [uncultured Selenomonas sp.]